MRTRTALVAGAIVVSGTIVLGSSCLADPVGGTATPASAPSEVERDSTPAPIGQVAAPSRPLRTPPGEWRIAFRDEFNGASLNTSKWEPTWFGEGTRMNRVGTYSRNVVVADGSVRLRLSSEGHGALIHTGYKRGHYRMPVGAYVEARILFPGNGKRLYNWPAWWVNSTDDHPAGGEHDIAEVLGRGALTVNYHSPSGDYNQGAVAGYWGDAFHRYGVHRKRRSADVYWDGRLVKSYPTDDDGRPLDLIFNVGAGKGPTKVGPAGAIRVDYVRAWHRVP